MDSETCPVQSTSKVDSEVNMEVVSNSQNVEDSVTHNEKQLESSEGYQTVSNSASGPEVNCEVACEEENPQIITGDECLKENDNRSIENMECGAEVLNSNSEKEVLETQAFEIGEINDNVQQNIASIEEKPVEKLDESCNQFQMDSSEKLDETVVVESDEEMKAEISENTQPVVEETKVENTSIPDRSDVLEKNFVPGDESQATTVDISEIDGKAPNSPEDLFASQSLGDTVKQNSENSLVAYEDFIPSSQSEKCENEEVDLSETASVSAPQKRKMDEENEECSDAKIPRLEVPLVIMDEEISEDKAVEKEEQEQKEIEVIDNNKVEETSGLMEASKIYKKTERSKSQERDTLTNEKIEEGDKREPINKDEKELEHSGESSNGIMSSKDSRKSVEIIFSSFENTDKQEEFVKPRPVLPIVPEENGEEYEEDTEMENFHLEMSLSPSQGTQSFIEANVSKDNKEVVSKLDATGKTSNGDTSSSDNLSNSHHISKSDSELNCHMEAPQNFPETVTVDDPIDLQISSPDGKTSNSNDIVVLKTVGNSSVSQSDDSDVTVLLDKTEDSDKSANSENAKHKDMNGTLLKRKRPESDEDTEKPVVLDEIPRIDTNSEIDTRKRTRLVNVPMEEKSTPDVPLLLSNKGKFQSTPNDNSRVTPMNASISTVEPASTSAGKDSSFPLRVVKRTYALQVQLHVHDGLRQVQSIEMVQCQNLEDYLLTNTVTRDTSGGSVADESRNSSPSSVMSLGPFSLKTQSWRLSNSSTSTNSSSHSNIGVKSKSDDWHFTAPLKPAPSQNNRLRNLQYSSEFERDLFELAERTWYNDETESKLSGFLAKPTALPVPSFVPTTTEILDGIKDVPQSKSETQESVVETPKSTKKLSRGNRNTRNRTLISKTLKEITGESSSQQTPEKDTPDVGESSSGQRKSRKPPSRSSKRTGRSTPSTPVTTEDSKPSTPTVPSSGRSRRNRTDQSQPEKPDSSSHESSLVSEWDAEGCFTKLVPEAPVFARWTDKKYYPGRIREKIKDGRWVIEFDDKTVRPLKEEFIIPINILTKGQIVFAYDGDEYEQGIIVEFKLKDGEVHYGVDLDSGRKLFVPRSRLFMSEDQARLLQEGMDPKSPTTSSPALTTVSCDNIVHHKRPRSTRVLFGNASPSVSGVAKTAKRPSHDTSCSSSVSDSNDKGPTLVLDEVVGVDPEVPSSFPESLHTPSGRGKGPGRIKSKTRTPRRNTPANHTIADTQEPNKLHEILGPIPVKGSKMFSGKCFLLTHSVVRPVDSSKMNASLKSIKKSDLKSSSEWEESSSDDGLDSKIPYVKEHLKQQLEAGGGVVYENFEDVPEDQYPNCFLVTNRPSLTAKYILSLANGIKIISYRWVIEEARGSSCPLTSARLQAGWDLEGQCYVLPEATVRTRKQKPLNKKEVGVVNESQTFVKFWERVLELLGANVRHISPGSPEQDRQFSGVDVILTDSTCPPEVQDRAREWSIPLVSTVWVTQSLINWRIRPYTGHPHYRYDYCASD